MNTHYFYDSSRKYGGSDYIFVSYFNYLKSQYVGKEYLVLPRAISILKSRYSDERVFNKDIETGEEVTYDPQNNIYKIVDLSVSEDTMLDPVVFIITNGAHTTYFDKTVVYRIDNGIREDIIEKAEWESLLATYGPDMMRCVLEEKVKVGMPKRLLLLSWGQPDKINRSSFSDDQYVYGSKCVYVDSNDIITAWN